ncbi:hypothetical protein VNO77_39083 [Canavalia gladiata]|uniref:LTI65/LTI78 N-terminal domain-containing protein n=1 Tax=Canavalia gladiata TaxID=3824 RepID=A0AAN9PVI0_CANGL
MMEICAKNIANRKKQTIPHTLGSKSIARKKYELEIEIGRIYSRGEMYSIAHKRKDGSFVNNEAREKSELLDIQNKDTTSDEDAYIKVFGKEHPGRVRVTNGVEDPQSDREKKSVLLLNKVKTKAKKIKDTIKKCGHQVLDRGNGNNNKDQHILDDHDLDDDEQMAQDPKV